ncbi:hypothetical protein [Aggregatibacter aphrophilus]|uniref:Uncharacterized protein n=1 Tax=Aggregatibacter aphrophilus TaxID=732 RepID=A0AAP7GXR2_AGGAP|nr:hypothetical protein [Aggregatibacter aphrophilus]OBY52850.1 hypothetical protein BBB52_05830 [Aggregatibacter aphrophilus]
MHEVFSSSFMIILSIVIIVIFHKNKGRLINISIYSSFLLISIQCFFWFKLVRFNIPSDIFTNSEFYNVREILIDFQGYLFWLAMCSLIFLSVVLAHYKRLCGDDKLKFFLLSSFQVSIFMTTVNFSFINPMFKLIFNMLYLILPLYVLHEVSKFIGKIRFGNIKRIIKLINRLEEKNK